MHHFLAEPAGLVLASLFFCLNLPELSTKDAELPLEVPLACPRGRGFLLEGSDTLLEGLERA